MPVDYSVIKFVELFVAIAVVAGALLIVGRGRTKEEAIDDMRHELEEYGEDYHIGKEIDPDDGSSDQVTVDKYDVY